LRVAARFILGHCGLFNAHRRKIHHQIFARCQIKNAARFDRCASNPKAASIDPDLAGFLAACRFPIRRPHLGLTGRKARGRSRDDPAPPTKPIHPSESPTFFFAVDTPSRLTQVRSRMPLDIGALHPSTQASITLAGWRPETGSLRLW